MPVANADPSGAERLTTVKQRPGRLLKKAGRFHDDH
jgi:hypothetical protein